MQVNGYFRRIRVIILAVLAILFALTIYCKYARLAFLPESERIESLPEIQRGSIVDRNGKPLAVSTNLYHFGVTPAAIKNVDAFAQAVALHLGMGEAEVKAIIKNAPNSNFVYLKKKIPQETYEKLREICDENRFHFARFDRIPGRIYPENALASSLVGYMREDGTGISGIEYSMQETLSPARHADTPLETQGKNVYLTIDSNLQYKLEKIARSALENTQAETMMLIAAEAKTGEILSYISLPQANLNEYGKASDEEKIDRPAADSYEPGSVFKIFSVASFIDLGGITPEDIFLCDGIYERRMNSGERIKITCLDHHGWVSAREALKYSCNDALAQMSEKVESEQLLAKIRQLGFGSKPGVELPLQTEGSVRNTSDRLWSARSKPTIAIGQEIAVSALQMVQAATSFANGGSPVQLTFINRITTHDGKAVYTHVPQKKDQVFKKSTAEYLLSCMETVAKSGTGHKAALGDISIGVKTGTAQMADPRGGYSTTDFLSNCLAIFPVEDPEIILYIVIEKAKGETYAGRIVAPVIADAADVIIDHMGMSRGSASSLAHNGLISITNNEPVTVGATVPDFSGLSKRALMQLLEREDIRVKISGDGWVTRQSPAAGTPVTENMEIELYLE